MTKGNAFLNGLAIGVIIGLAIGGFSIFAACSAFDCPALQKSISSLGAHSDN